MNLPEKSLKFRAFYLLTFYYCFKLLYFKNLIHPKVVDKRFVICIIILKLEQQNVSETK